MNLSEKIGTTERTKDLFSAEMREPNITKKSAKRVRTLCCKDRLKK